MPIDYLPILILVIVALVFAVLALLVPALLGPRKPTAIKLSTYETGKIPFGTTSRRFPVKYYLTAVLFILFDIEVIFLYPWAVISRSLGMFGLIEMLVFVVILLVGYFYILGRGALKWD